MRPTGLPADEVHVWLVRQEACDAAVLEACRPLLSDAEHERGARFYFQRDRDRHVITRALVRSTLSRYVPVSPETWEFACNAWGRPEIAAPSAGLGVRFNVSHTDGLIACAVAWERQIGVDVEYAARRLDVRELAPTVFADSELRALLRLPEERQRERFFALWTLKEAYIKARGMGLALSLQRFAYELDDGLSLSIDPSLGDSGDTWQLWHILVTPEHHLALAARRQGELTVILRTGVPLGSWSSPTNIALP